jgi:uncharacterized protein (TIGR03437 family)
MRTFNYQFENHFCYHWNSARRRAHILVSILAMLLALMVLAASPLGPARAAGDPALTALQDENVAVMALLPSGNDLYVAGNFNTIGGIAANGIARYNMATNQWFPLGANQGLNGNGVNGLIKALALVGNDLYVGGSFLRAYNATGNSISANCVAKWNTQTNTWSALGTGTEMGTNGINGDANAIAVVNGAVFYGGNFKKAFNSASDALDANGIARWSNGQWTLVGRGVSNPGSLTVNDLAVVGTDLYVGGSFNMVHNTAANSSLTVDCIARWSTVTNSWTQLGAGNGSGNNGVTGDVLALTVNGTDVYVGGTFTQVNNSTASKVSANHLAKWDGSAWGVVGNASMVENNGVNGTIYELYFNNNTLYVAGDFDVALNNGSITSANRIVRWSGSSWAALGSSAGINGNGVNDEVQTIMAAGGNLYVGGIFTEAYNNSANMININSLARWNGSSWTTLGATTIKSLAVLSAASFSGTGFSTDGIGAAYGTGLASSTSTATTVPLPTSLVGTSVAVRDSAGTSRAASLFFVSGGQVNFVIPAGTANGVATVTITAGDGSLSAGDITIASVSPGLFTMNSNGVGAVAGQALRVRGAVQTYETINTLNTSTNRWVTKAIDLGPATDQVYLILFGTGFRNRSSLANVSVTVGGVPCDVSFASKQGGLVGVDQVNLLLPRSLAGRGEVDLVLTVDGKLANTVKVNIL